MDMRYTKIQQFIDACDELIGGTYMLADTNIAEALKAVSKSGELRDLFQTATEGFDFPAAKRAYLKYPAEQGAQHGIAYLPSDRKEILAFVFCLFVELDAGALKLNDFLLRYFYSDGSYTASFSAFTERMIRPFRDIVRSCFPDYGKKGQLEMIGKRQDAVLELLAERVTVERARIAAIPLLSEERTASEVILDELSAAVGRKDVNEICAILSGYRYFLRYINAEDSVSGELFTLSDEL